MGPNVKISMFPVFLSYGIFFKLQPTGNNVKSSASSSLRSLNITKHNLMTPEPPIALINIKEESTKVVMLANQMLN